MSNSNAQQLIQTARALSLFTIFYNVVEGCVAIFFGLEESSVALAGFGFDSFIEVFSALIVFWKVSGSIDHDTLEKREKYGLRGMGMLFLLLAAVTAGGSVYQLLSHSHPETTFPGVVISLLSLSFMFYLWKSKMRIGTELDDAVILGDAACTLACIKLSFVLLFGSFIYWVAPSLWWIDSVAALAISYFIAREGVGFFSDNCGHCH